MEIQSKKLIGSDRYRFGDRQLLIGIGIGSADQEKLLIGRSLVAPKSEPFSLISFWPPCTLIYLINVPVRFLNFSVKTLIDVL